MRLLCTSLSIGAVLCTLACSQSAPTSARQGAAVDAFVQDWLANNGDLIQEAGLEGKPIGVRIAIEGAPVDVLRDQWHASQLPVTLVTSPASDPELAVLRVSLNTYRESDADTVALVGSWRGTDRSCSIISYRSIEFSGGDISVQGNGNNMYVMW